MCKKCRVFGYCRISTNKQSIARQERNITALYPNAIIIKEAYSGRKTEERKEFQKLLRIVESGDCIVFDSVSRMSRLEEGFTIYQELYNKGVELVFLKEPHINTATYREALKRQIEVVETGDKATDNLLKSIIEGINAYMMELAKKQIELAFIQSAKEVEDLQQRTREGLVSARLAGKQIGAIAGKKRNIPKANKAKEQIKKFSKDFEGTLNDIEVMKLVEVSRKTYYKYKAELKDGE